MSEVITICLSRSEVGQILDGLEVRAEAWEKTSNYLRSGRLPEDKDFQIEECTDISDAEAIAQDYRSIIEKIQSQLKARE